MAFDILELSHIPRERDKLKVIISTARHQRRKARMMRYSAYAILAVGIMILWLNACSHAGSTPTIHNKALHTLYVPEIQR